MTDALGVALVAVELWRRLTPGQRRRVIAVARTHAPRVIGSAARIRRPAGRRR